MTRGHEDSVAALDGLLEAEPVAVSLSGNHPQREHFLFWPHPQVLEIHAQEDPKTTTDAGIGGMRKLHGCMATAETRKGNAS